MWLVTEFVLVLIFAFQPFTTGAQIPVMQRGQMNGVQDMDMNGREEGFINGMQRGQMNGQQEGQFAGMPMGQLDQLQEQQINGMADGQRFGRQQQTPNTNPLVPPIMQPLQQFRPLTPTEATQLQDTTENTDQTPRFKSTQETPSVNQAPQFKSVEDDFSDKPTPSLESDQDMLSVDQAPQFKSVEDDFSDKPTPSLESDQDMLSVDQAPQFKSAEEGSFDDQTTQMNSAQEPPSVDQDPRFTSIEAASFNNQKPSLTFDQDTASVDQAPNFKSIEEAPTSNQTLQFKSIEDTTIGTEAPQFKTDQEVSSSDQSPQFKSAEDGSFDDQTSVTDTSIESQTPQFKTLDGTSPGKVLPPPSDFRFVEGPPLGNLYPHNPTAEQMNYRSPFGNSRLPATPLPPDYCSLGVNHTMCIYQPHGCNRRNVKILSSAMSMDDIHLALGLHNYLRHQVSMGYVQGLPAADPEIPSLEWDPELAAVAQRWADQCILNHDQNRRTESFSYVGQNDYWVGSSAPLEKNLWKVTVETWFDEVSNFIEFGGDVRFYNTTQIQKGDMWRYIGGFSQIVWSRTKFLGCGQLFIQDTEDDLTYQAYMVCNYGPGGNIAGLPMYNPTRA